MSNGESMIATNQIRKGIFVALLSFFSLTLMATTIFNAKKESVEFYKKKEADLLKKYGSFRPIDILALNVVGKKSDLVDIENKYFSISYPKCFIVESTSGVDDNVDIKKSTSLDFKRTSNCKLYKKNLELDSLQLFYEANYSDPQHAESDPAQSNSVYRQTLNVNGATGVVYLNFSLSTEGYHWRDPILEWEGIISCEGKASRSFKFLFLQARDNDVDVFMKIKKFELPEDFMQIISTFKCRKDL